MIRKKVLLPILLISICLPAIWAGPIRADLLEWQSLQPSFLDTAVTGKTITRLTVFNNKLYAGISPNCPEIWQSSDGNNWTRVFQADFGGSNIGYFRFFIFFKDYLYAGIASGDYSTIYRTRDGLNWFACSTFSSVLMFAEVFQDHLYIIVGETLYRSKNGIDWEFSARLNGLMQIRSFGDCLYATLINNNSLLEIWRSRDGLKWEVITENMFGETGVSRAYALTAFESYLYLGTTLNSKNFQVWRTSNGMDWERVGEAGLSGNTSNDDWVMHMAVLGSQLYLGTHIHTYDTDRGAKIWRTADGLNWEQVNENGFGNPNRYRVEYGTMTVFRNQLYLGTGNEGSIPDTINMGGAMIHRTVNHVPVGEEASVETQAEQSVQVTLSASDDDGDPLTYQIAYEPANGQVTLNGNVATYTPNSGFYGLDQFTWKASDGKMISAAGEVVIRILHNEEPASGTNSGGGCFFGSISH